MHFRMLGPLEATHDGRTIALRGLKQRATLAYLLLHANHVVPTSQLLDALWPGDDPPMSARKMLQNAVWSLRSVLEEANGVDGGVSLETQAPGYILKVPPQSVDWLQFQQQAEAGRQVLAAGDARNAVGLLGEALGSWRSEALADLSESGVAWPELDAVERLRLDTLEDFYEAELLCGQHRAVLGGLDDLVTREPLRERACGLQMLALYRSGRHAEALEVYGRLRGALVEELGLEPGPELQQLQSSILSHDAKLTSEECGDPTAARQSLLPNLAVIRETPESALSTSSATASMDGNAAATTPTSTSVLLIQAHPPLSEDPDDLEVERVLAAAAGLVEDIADRFDGRLVTTLGSTAIVVFDRPSNDLIAPDRAIQAALDFRQQVMGLENLPHRLVMRASVVTGRPVWEGATGGATPPVNRALVDRGHRLMMLVPEDCVWICDRTRRRSERRFLVDKVNVRPSMWSVQGERPETTPPVVMIDHSSQLLVLDALLERIGQQKTPHLLTIVDGSSAPLAGLLGDFECAIESRPSPTGLIRANVSQSSGADLATVQAQLLRSYCGMEQSNDVTRASRRLATAFAGLNCSDAEPDRLISDLLPLFEVPSQRSAPDAAWSRFLGLAVDRQPTVMLIEGLHAVGEEALESLERLVRTAQGALLVVVTARPELLERRPFWGNGQRAATITVADPAKASSHLGSMSLPWLRTESFTHQSRDA